MRIAAGLVSLLLALQLMPARAQDQWREFRSDSDGFSIELPQTPTVSARRIGKSEATQTMFLIEQGRNAWLVSVIQLAKGAGPKKPDNAYFQGLLKNYADGSKTTARSSRMTTLAGQPALEAITEAPEAAHLVDLTAVGDRVYMLVYVGAKGQETGPDALRFRDSFKLIN